MASYRHLLRKDSPVREAGASGASGGFRWRCVASSEKLLVAIGSSGGDEKLRIAWTSVKRWLLNGDGYFL